MKIYFTKIGVEKSRDTSQDNFVYGDNLTGTIEAYFDELDPKNYLNRLVVQRPDGTRTNELPMILTQDQLGVYYQLNNSLINQAGTYHITIRLKEANDGEYIIKAASQFDIIIDKGVMASDDTNITSAEYASLVDKLNKVDVKASVAKQYTSLEEVGFNDAKFHIGTDFYNACSKLPRGCRIYLNLVKDVDKTKYPNFYSFITSQPDAYKCLNDVSYIKTFNIEIVNTRGVYKDDNSINGITQYYVNFNALENEIETTVSYVWGLNGELWFKTSNKVYSNFDEISYNDSEDINAFGNKRGTILLLKNYIEQNKDLYPVLYDRLKAVNGYATDNDAMFIIQHSYDEDHDITSLMYTNGNSLHYYTTNGWVEIKKTDDQINANSDNPISNKAITNYLNSIVEGLKNGTTHVGYAEKAYKDSYGSIINVSNLLASISSLLGNSEDGSDKKTIWGLSNRISETQQMFNQQLSAVNIDLQGQIDAINAGQNLADIVGTFADLENYNTEYLHVGDKIEVMQDETHSNSSTIYNWNGTTFEYVGSFGGGGGGGNSYTKAESDERYAKKDETYTKLEADNKFVQSTNTVLTGTTKLENAIISGDGKIHHLEVEESITVPNPSDKTNATNKEYVDNGMAYEVLDNGEVEAAYGDKLTNLAAYYKNISTDADTDFGTFFIKGNNNLPKYNGTITLNGKNATLTFKWNNGAEDVSETITIVKAQNTPLANLLTNVELKNNGYFNTINLTYNNPNLRYLKMLVIKQSNLLANAYRNSNVIIKVNSSKTLTENEFKALKANMTNVCFKNTNGMYYYFAGFDGSTIYYSTIQSDKMRNTHNIEYSNIKVDYMYGTYTITDGSIMPEVQQVDDTSLDLVSGKTVALAERVVFRYYNSQNNKTFDLYYSGRDIKSPIYYYWEADYENKHYEIKGRPNINKVALTITDLPSTELPVITLTGESGTLTAEQAALLDKDNVIIKYSISDDNQDYRIFQKYTRYQKYDNNWIFYSLYADPSDSVGTDIYVIDITLQDSSYNWSYADVDLDNRFVYNYNFQGQIDTLKTGKQNVIQYVEITKETPSVLPSTEWDKLKTKLDYIVYTTTIDGEEKRVVLNYAEQHNTVNHHSQRTYVGYIPDSNNIPQPITAVFSWDQLTVPQAPIYTIYEGVNLVEDSIVSITGVPDTATEGTFTQEQIKVLQNNPHSIIEFNNEYYIQMDNEYEVGHLVYTHVGQDTTNSFFTKSINITLSTRGWVLTKIKQASVEYVDNKASGITVLGTGEFGTIASLKTYIESNTSIATNIYKAKILDRETTVQVTNDDGGYQIVLSFAVGRVLYELIYTPSYGDDAWIEKKSTIHSFTSATIESSLWTDLTGSDPFKAQCNITLLELSSAKDVLELINDNAVLFANYGFNIGAVSNTTVTIYALKKPTGSVTLQFEMEG